MWKLWDSTCFGGLDQSFARRAEEENKSSNSVGIREGNQTMMNDYINFNKQ